MTQQTKRLQDFLGLPRRSFLPPRKDMALYVTSDTNLNDKYLMSLRTNLVSAAIQNNITANYLDWIAKDIQPRLDCFTKARNDRRRYPEALGEGSHSGSIRDSSFHSE